MIEAIILSMTTFLIGSLVGAFLTTDYMSRKRVISLKLDCGKEIHMWKGFVDPTKVFVAADTDENNDFIDGDGVVFDANGNIIIVNKNEKR